MNIRRHARIAKRADDGSARLFAKPGIQIVVPNPKTSGGARWAYLAAWAYAEKKPGGNAEKAKSFVGELYKHVPVLDSGARGATVTFAQRHIGDVHLAWENEAHLEVQESGGKLQIVHPPVSLKAEPPVAVVDANVQRKGTRAAAVAYLKWLYSAEAQEIIARNGYRPADAEVLRRHAATFPELTLFPITVVAPSWEEAQRRFCGAGGIFDRVYGSSSRATD